MWSHSMRLPVRFESTASVSGPCRLQAESYVAAADAAAAAADDDAAGMMK